MVAEERLVLEAGGECRQVFGLESQVIAIRFGIENLCAEIDMIERTALDGGERLNTRRQVEIFQAAAGCTEWEELF